MLNSVVDSSQFVAHPSIRGYVKSGHAPDFGLQCAENIYFEGGEDTPPPPSAPKSPLGGFPERQDKPSPPLPKSPKGGIQHGGFRGGDNLKTGVPGGAKKK